MNAEKTECCSVNTITGQCILPGMESMKEALDDTARRELMKERGHVFYDELDEAGQEKAREWFLRDYPDYCWWEDDESWRNEIAEAVGFGMARKNNCTWTLDRGRDYAIDAQWEYNKGWKEYFRKNWGKGTYARYGFPDADVFTMDPKQIDRKLEGAKGSIRFIEFVQEIERAIMEFSVKRFYRGEFNAYIRRHGGGSFSQGIDECRDYNRADSYEVDQHFDEEAAAIVDAYTSYMLDVLDAEYDWLTSDEHAAEMIRANEYEFDTDGNRV